MFGMCLLVSLLYAFCAYRAFEYLLKNTLNHQRKAIVSNIILTCTVYLFVLSLNHFSGDYKFLWAGAGLLNGLTYLHIIHILRENP